MTVPTIIGHADLVRAVERMHLGVGASDLHGSLVGYLCGGGEPGEAWLGALQLKAEALGADDEVLLARLLAFSRACLDTAGPYFEPLLPDPDSELEQRVRALVDWCRGFLGGLGLAGAGDPHNMSVVAADIVHDFSAVAATHFAVGNVEDDSAALTDLREFVCDGVLLLRAELRTPTVRGQALQDTP